LCCPTVENPLLKLICCSGAYSAWNE
jgi:hypothetical protein